MKPIVIVHGLFGDHNDGRILGAFGSHAVFAPDLMGYGSNRHMRLSDMSLYAQAQHVVDFLDANNLRDVHLVGHSIGGAVATIVASEFSERLASLTSVEGNFTVRDAFWSGKIAVMSDRDVSSLLNSYRSDPVEWFGSMGIASNQWADELAVKWLDYQPHTTIRAQASAVVSATSDPTFLTMAENVFRSKLPVNLIAGSRSAAAWDTPVWANQCCATRINIPNVGHMMMAEDPDRYAEAILSCVSRAF